jgi:hypothetical protein
MKPVNGAPWVWRLNLPWLVARAALPYLLGGLCLGAVLGALMLHACGCSTPAILVADPKVYPCGPTGVVCVVQKACCDQGETCGGEPQAMPGCPAGECCYVESNDPVLEKRARRKQRPQP